MIPGGNEKHANDEEHEAHDEIRPVKRNEENAEREKMNCGKRERQEDRNTGAVRQRNRPIARESSHPASFLHENQVQRETQPERGERKCIFSVGSGKVAVN